MSGRSGVAAEEDNHSDIFVGDRRPSDAGRFADAVTDGAMFVRVNSKCAHHRTATEAFRPTGESPEQRGIDQP